MFKRVFDDPGNIELTFRFADAAIRRGDYEAAIGALERILLFNPNLPRVRLQLGQLYAKLGAAPVARSHFEQARTARNAPPDVREQAERELAGVGRAASPHRWSLFAHTGFRYQSNATAGPSSGIVRALGNPVPVDQRFAKTPDWNWFLLFGIDYVYDLRRGNEDALEVSAVGYHTNQFRLPKFDLSFAEVQAGPRFSLPADGTSIKVYAIGGGAALADNPYFATIGAGVSMRFNNVKYVGRVQPSLEFRDRTFRNSSVWPTAGQQSGELVTAAVTAEGLLFDKTPWVGRLAFERNRAAANFNGYDRWSFVAGFPIAFNHAWAGETPRQYVVTPVAGIGHTSYAGPNTNVDGRVVRRDWDWQLGLILDAQIYANYGIRTQVLYFEQNSNLPNHELRNWSFIVGPTARF